VLQWRRENRESCHHFFAVCVLPCVAVCDAIFVAVCAAVCVALFVAVATRKWVNLAIICLYFTW